MLDDEDEFEADNSFCGQCENSFDECDCCWLCDSTVDNCHCDDETMTDEVKPEITPEQLKNLGSNLAGAAKAVHNFFEVEEMKRLEPADKQVIIDELAKTLTDEQVREVILKLQKALCSR